MILRARSFSLSAFALFAVLLPPSLAESLNDSADLTQLEDQIEVICTSNRDLTGSCFYYGGSDQPKAQMLCTADGAGQVIQCIESERSTKYQCVGSIVITGNQRLFNCVVSADPPGTASQSVDSSDVMTPSGDIMPVISETEMTNPFAKVLKQQRGKFVDQQPSPDGNAFPNSF